MINVLFVCLGNICRSPMAEAIFRHMVKEAGLEGAISVESAGIGEWHVGEPPHKGTRRLLKQKGISTEGITARQITPDDFERFEYIVTMDQENLAYMERQRGEAGTAKVRLLMTYVKDPRIKEVPDPYYTGDFNETYELIEAGCRALLDHIRRHYNV